MSFAEDLEALGPCPESIVWVGDKTLRESWDACDNLVRMLWLLHKTRGWDGWPSHVSIVELGSQYLEDVEGYQDTFGVVDAAREWIDGVGTDWAVWQAADKAFGAGPPESNALYLGQAVKHPETCVVEVYKLYDASALSQEDAIDQLRSLIPSSSLPETLGV